MKKHHSLLYIVEFVIIGLGFAYLLTANISLQVQLISLGAILFLYVAVGLFHHNTHHDISIKVVLEYILVSALLFALFVFLNITRI